MITSFSLTIMMGSALVACGYILGKSAGWRQGCDETIKEIISTRLIEPVDVLRHYANMGNERAQLALEKLNAERKAKFMEKNDG